MNRLQEAITKLAALKEGWSLAADTDAASFIGDVEAEITRLTGEIEKREIICISCGSFDAECGTHLGESYCGKCGGALVPVSEMCDVITRLRAERDDAVGRLAAVSDEIEVPIRGGSPSYTEGVHAMRLIVRRALSPSFQCPGCVEKDEHIEELQLDPTTGPWEKVAAVAKRILDRTYPSHTFTGVSGDIGPQVVAALHKLLDRDLDTALSGTGRRLVARVEETVQYREGEGEYFAIVNWKGDPLQEFPNESVTVEIYAETEGR